MKRWPMFTLPTIAMAVLVWLTPGATAGLVYERQAILDGELWRLLTCQFVHFSESHLVLNLLAIGALGTLVEMRTVASRVALFVVVPVAIAGGLLLTEPDMLRYGGLSGLGTAALSYLLLELLTAGSKFERRVGGVALVGLIVKMGLEWGQPPLWASISDPAVTAASMSHLLGAGLAGIVFGLDRLTTCVPSHRGFVSTHPQ